MSIQIVLILFWQIVSIEKRGIVSPMILKKHTAPHISQRPSQATRKYSQKLHVLVIIDAFTKFVWIYPTKSKTAIKVIVELNIQKAVFWKPCSDHY